MLPVNVTCVGTPRRNRESTRLPKLLSVSDAAALVPAGML